VTSDSFADLGDLFVLPLTLVPPRRLGELLRLHREAQARELAAVSAATRGAVTVRDLRRLETSGVVPGAGLDETIRAYGVDPGLLVPPRRPIELDPGASWLSADRLDEPWRLQDGDLDELLLRYLALVYALRAQPAGSPLTMRAADLETLGRATGLTGEEITRVATRIVATRHPELTALTAEARRRLAASATSGSGDAGQPQ